MLGAEPILHEEHHRTSNTTDWCCALPLSHIVHTIAIKFVTRKKHKADQAPRHDEACEQVLGSHSLVLSIDACYEHQRQVIDVRPERSVLRSEARAWRA